MRAKGRNQGQFVALSGLRKVVAPPGSRYKLIILDEHGLPVFHLSEWYVRRKGSGAERTRDTYLDMLLPFVGFQLRKGYIWNAEPDRVRAALIEFLRDDVKCQMRPDRERDGYLLETTGHSPLSKSSLGVFLAAVASLYDVLADAGYYPYHNPMRSESLLAVKREHLQHVEHAGAPDHAGIRGESWQETNRYPTGYFRQLRGKVWEPDLVMEPDEVQDRMRKTVDSMIQHATFQRDKVILLLLRATGARLYEILSMTAGGYRNAGHACRALVVNKGSHGREEKMVYFTSAIERELAKYIRDERARYDSQGRKRLCDLDDTDPIFLTTNGTPYTRAAFYYHWYTLFEQAAKRYHVAFSPHDLRHLYVTKNLATIETKANGDEHVEQELRDGFRQLMGWRSQDTMETYAHLLNKRKALFEVVQMQDSLEQSPTAPPHGERPAVTRVQDPSPLTTDVRSQDTDDANWYEE